jgi:site-specific DNA recombinase
MMKAARDGFFTGGRVPFGYVSIEDGNRHRLVIHPTEAETVKRMYQLSLQGDGVKVIAMTLNDSGTLMRGATWTKNTVNYMLRSEVYYGISIFNKTSQRIPNPEDLWIRVNSHPGIVDSDTFGRVQLALGSRLPERVGGIPRSDAVFAGLLRCGHCNGAVSLTNGTSRTGDRHHYYACSAHMRGKLKCTFKNIKVASFDAWLISELLDKVLTSEVVKDVVEQVTAMGGQWARDRELRRIAIVRALRATEGKRGKLYGVLELMGTDAPNLADLGPRLKQLNDEIKGLEQSLMKLEEEPVEPRHVPKIDIEEASGMLRGLVQDCEDPKKVRTFLASFIEKATVSGDNVAVFYNEGRMMSLGGSAVRSEGKWLLNLGSNQGPTD